MGRQRNIALEQLLVAHGLSHQELANEVNRAIADLFGLPGDCTDRHVRRWVSGEVRWPWTRYLQALQRVFGVPAQAMGFVPRGKSTRLPSPPQSSDKAGEEGPVERRTFLSGALITALGVDQPPRRGRIGSSDVNRIEQSVARLDAHFNGLGGGAVIDAATEYVRWLQRALDHCSYSQRVEKSLYLAVAAVAACAGWSAHDCGRCDEARHWRDEALQATLLSGDPVAQARAWSDLAAQAELVGRPGEAARINRTALADRRIRHHALMVTLLNARLADYLGSTGDLAGMGRHLAAAERAYDRADITTAVSWLAFISPAELNGLSAIAHQSVGRYDRAERLVSQTLEILGPQFGRNRTYYTVLLSELQLAGGDVERAAATISEVRIEKVTSSRISSRVDQVASAIRRHRGGQS